MADNDENNRRKKKRKVVRVEEEEEDEEEEEVVETFTCEYCNNFSSTNWYTTRNHKVACKKIRGKVSEFKEANLENLNVEVLVLRVLQSSKLDKCFHYLNADIPKFARLFVQSLRILIALFIKHPEILKKEFAEVR